jgi:hypothetical protein
MRRGASCGSTNRFTEYGISELRKQTAAAKAVVTKAPAKAAEMESAAGPPTFAMRDIHPAAAETLREFASQVVGTSWDGSAMWYLRPSGNGMNGQDATVRAAMITLRVAELRLLAAATAVAWGRSPGKSFEQIAGEAHDSAKRFLEALRTVIGPAE